MRKRTMAALGLAGAVGALALREAWQRRQDAETFEAGRDYWEYNLPGEVVRWTKAHLKQARIPSQGLGVNLDVYARAEQGAPVVVITHGLLTYGRLFAPLAMLLYERGYAVVCPDLVGNGFSGGVRGDLTVGAGTTALVDATLWARRHFDGPIYLLGVSLGGAVTYAAAAAGAPVTAIACVDLFTFDDRAALRQLIARPWLVSLLPLARLAAVPLGWARVPTSWIHTIDRVVAPEEARLTTAWKFDPLPPRSMTLRSLVSAGYTPPRVPLEHNTIPTLVINQEADRALSPAVTRACFQRLGGPKRYVGLEGANHWSFQPEFYRQIAAASDEWFRSYGAAPVASAVTASVAARE